MEKPFIWQMIKEAVEQNGGKADYMAIKLYIANKWGQQNDSTVNAQTIALTVNQPSRVGYTQNKKPRLANGQYDLLFSVAAGQVVRYDPQEHGIWRIYASPEGKLKVGQVLDDPADTIDDTDDDVPVLFPLEANLRDFLITNLHTFKDFKLKLFVDAGGRDGREYQTDVGPIDILTQDEQENFVVIELKLSRGPDRALGQLLRYMGWVKAHLSHGRPVKGIIVASILDEKLKYAVSVTNDIQLYEYEMKFELSKPDPVKA